MKYLKSHLKSEKGLTLVEVIVTIMIFSVVSSAIFQFMSSGLDSFDYGVEQTNERADLRLAMYQITEEVRNCFEADVAVDESSVTNERQFLVLEGKEVLIKEKDALGNVTTVRNLTTDVVQNIGFEVFMESPNIPGNPNKYTLTITLSGDTVSLASNILLNNIQDNDINAIGSSTLFEYSNIIN